MRASVRRSRLITLAAALALTGAVAEAGPPWRVVSINLCTDQLALLLAAPDQLVSISKLAHDPSSSAMATAAQGFPANDSRAEEVYLLAPDLVLAGTFTDPATLQMLRDLGVAVEVFAPALSLAEIPERLAQMGRALGRETEAQAQIDAFEAELNRLDDAGPGRPRAALYYVNSYTSGHRTLAGDILRAAGFDNVADEAGLPDGGTLALEQLVMLAPEVIVRGRDYPGQSRAEDNLRHPALDALQGSTVTAARTDRSWICGAPNVLEAVREMRDLRLSLEAGR